MSVVCCQVEFCASGLSLVQRSPTVCGASLCDREDSTTRLRLKRGCRSMGKNLCWIIGGIMLAGFSWLSEAGWFEQCNGSSDSVKWGAFL